MKETRNIFKKIRLSLLPFFIAFRYIKGRGGKLLSVNTRLSFIGVFTGTSLLVVVISVFGGFQEQFKKSLFEFDPHLIIKNETGDRKIKNWRPLVEKTKSALKEKASSVEGMIQSPAIVRKQSIIDYVFIRAQQFKDLGDNRLGIPENFPEIVQPKKLESLPNEDVCVVGKEMAFLLDLKIGDTIELVVPRGQFTLKTGVPPNMRPYTIVGFFKTGYYDHDSRLVIIPLESAQRLFGISDAVQQIIVRLHDMNDLYFARSQISKIYRFLYSIRTIEDEHRNFFAALNIEKTVQVTIVFMFIIAAMVGIVVATYNVVRSKKRDIGILKSLGISRNAILMIFTLNGFLTGIFATIMGIMFGIFLSDNLEAILLFFESLINKIGLYYVTDIATGDAYWENIRLIPKNVYYFDHLPIHYDIDFLQAAGFVSILLSGIAAFIPAWSASRMRPIDIIRGSDT
ncbi:MAG: ABC transporter permease [Spirochaetia bacterium]|nr:ABC transporter permease [Spirochaetia bacterium]